VVAALGRDVLLAQVEDPLDLGPHMEGEVFDRVGGDGDAFDLLVGRADDEQITISFFRRALIGDRRRSGAPGCRRL
jgi:hypothetical protein